MRKVAFLSALAVIFAVGAFAVELPICHAPVDFMHHDTWPNKYSDRASEARLRTPCTLAEHPALQDAWLQFAVIYEPIELGPPYSSRETWSHALSVLTQLHEWERTGFEPSDWRIQHEA